MNFIVVVVVVIIGLNANLSGKKFPYLFSVGKWKVKMDASKKIVVCFSPKKIDMVLCMGSVLFSFFPPSLPAANWDLGAYLDS